MGDFLDTLLPDNILEFLLLGTVGGTGFYSTSYFIDKLNEEKMRAAKLESTYENLLKEKAKQFEKKELELLEKIKKQCLSNETLDYLKSIGS